MKPSTFALPIILAAGIVSAASAQTAGADHALLCNGATDFVASTILPRVANTFTMEAWVNPTTTHEVDAENGVGLAGCAGQHYAVYPLHGTACWGPGHAGAGFSVGTNGVSVYEHAEIYMPATLVYEGKIEGWTHVAVVFNDRVPSLYINGRFVKSGVRGTMEYVHPSAGKATDQKYKYGGIGGGPLGYFAGEIDNVRIWDRALTAERIGDAMKRGAADTDGLLLDFDMDRTGRGSGLALASAGSTASHAIAAGTTFGTAATPVFTPRAHAPSPVRTQAAPAPATLDDTTPHAKAERPEKSDDARPTIE